MDDRISIFGDESAVATSAGYRSVYLEGFTCWMEMSSICWCSGLEVLDFWNWLAARLADWSFLMGGLSFVFIQKAFGGKTDQGPSAN